MSALGAITSTLRGPANGAGLSSLSGPSAPTTAASPAAAPAPSQFIESKIAGLYLTGDPLTDRVVKEFESDPIRHGSVENAATAVSASYTYDPTLGADQRPVPGATLKVAPENSILKLSPTDVLSMSTADVIAANESMFAEVMRSGTTQGFELLRQASAPGNALDAKLDQMHARQTELIEQAKALKGTPGELGALVAANKAATEVLLLEKEREKKEALRRLLWSLMCGVVPKSLIARMVELGMGHIVEKAIQDMVRNGRTISKSMSQQLHGLQDLGIQVDILPEHLTVDAEAQEDARLAAQAQLMRDGRLVDARGRTVGVGAAQDGAKALQGLASTSAADAGAGVRTAALGAGGVSSSITG